MRRIALALGLSLGFVSTVASADCPSPVARDQIAPCVVTNDLAIERERDDLRARQGSRTAALPLFPSNPTVSATFARRSVDGAPSVWNWSVAVSQEIEIAGQRGHRLDAANAEIDAATRRLLTTERSAIADAYRAYYLVLGAKAEVALEVRLEGIARALTTSATAGAAVGASAGVDADLAEAELYRAVRARIAAEGAVTASATILATRLGLDPTKATDAVGDLEPLPVLDDARAALGRESPQVLALRDDSRAYAARAALFRVSAVPNLLLTAFVQEDGFAERVLGLGLALPIPFPQPVGRTFVGEAREAKALADRATTEADRVERERRGALVAALAAYDAAIRARDAIPADRIDRANATLAAVAQEVAERRMAVRDAVLVEQTLTALLVEHARARLEACLASVELARAASLPLEGAGR